MSNFWEDDVPLQPKQDPKAKANFWEEDKPVALEPNAVDRAVLRQPIVTAQPVVQVEQPAPVPAALTVADAFKFETPNNQLLPPGGGVLVPQPALKGIGGGSMQLGQSLNPNAKAVGWGEGVVNSLLSGYHGKDAAMADNEFYSLLAEESSLEDYIKGSENLGFAIPSNPMRPGVIEPDRNARLLEDKKKELLQVRERIVQARKEKDAMEKTMSGIEGRSASTQAFSKAANADDLMAGGRVLKSDYGLGAAKVFSEMAAQSAWPSGKSAVIDLVKGIVAGATAVPTAGGGPLLIYGGGAAAQGGMTARDSFVGDFSQNFKEYLQKNGVDPDNEDAVIAFRNANRDGYREALRTAKNLALASSTAEGTVTGGMSIIPGAGAIKTASKNPLVKFAATKAFPLAVEAFKEGGEELLVSSSRQGAEKLAGGTKPYSLAQDAFAAISGAGSGGFTELATGAGGGVLKKGYQAVRGQPAPGAPASGPTPPAATPPPPVAPAPVAPVAPIAGEVVPPAPVAPVAPPVAATPPAPVAPAPVAAPPPPPPLDTQAAPVTPAPVAPAAPVVATEAVEPAPANPGPNAPIELRREWWKNYDAWVAKNGKTHWNNGTPKPASYLEGTPEFAARVEKEKKDKEAAAAPAVDTPAPVADVPVAETPTPASATPPPVAPATPAPAQATPAPAYDGGDPRNDPRFADQNRDTKTKLRELFSSLGKREQELAGLKAKNYKTDQKEAQIAKIKKAIGKTLGDADVAPAPVAQAAPAPVAQPAPAAQAAPTPQVDTTPAPVAQATPAPTPAPAPTAAATPSPAPTPAPATPAPATPAPGAKPARPSLISGLREGLAAIKGREKSGAPAPTVTPSGATNATDPRQDRRYDNVPRPLRQTVNVLHNKVINDQKSREQAVVAGRSTKNLDDRIAKNKAEIERILSNQPKVKPNAPVNPDAAPIDPMAADQTYDYQDTPAAPVQEQTTEDDPEVQAAKYPNPNPNLDKPIPNSQADFYDERAAELERSAVVTPDSELKKKFSREAKDLRDRAEAMRKADNEQAVRDSQGQARPINRDENGDPEANRPDDEEDTGDTARNAPKDREWKDGLIDADLSDFLREGGKTVRQTLQHIIDLDGRFAPLARILLRSDSATLDLPVNVEQDSDSGQYYLNFNEDYERAGTGPERINVGDIGETEILSIEEIVHALTVTKAPDDFRAMMAEALKKKPISSYGKKRFVNNGDRRAAQVEVAQQYVKSGKNKDFKTVCEAWLKLRELEAKGEATGALVAYRTMDFWEFFPGVMIDQEVMDALKKIPSSEGGNIFKKVINAFKRIFGFSDADMSSMFGDAVSAVQRINESERTLKPGGNADFEAQLSGRSFTAESPNALPPAESDPENYFKKTKPGQKIGKDGLPVRDQTGLPNFFEIGHYVIRRDAKRGVEYYDTPSDSGYEGRKGSVLYVMDGDTNQIGSIKDQIVKDAGGEDRTPITHDIWLTEMDSVHEPSNVSAFSEKGNLQGRMEPPIVKNGKVVEKGRISIGIWRDGENDKFNGRGDPSRRLDPSYIKSLKEDAAKRYSKETGLKLDPSDFDVYDFRALDDEKAEMGISRDDRGPVLRSPKRNETPLSKLMKKDIMNGNRPAWMDATGPKINNNEVVQLFAEGLVPQSEINPDLAYNTGFTTDERADGNYAPLEVTISKTGVVVKNGNMTDRYSFANKSRDGWRGFIEALRLRHDGRYDRFVVNGQEISKESANKQSNQAVVTPDGDVANHTDANLAKRGFISAFASETLSEADKKSLSLTFDYDEKGRLQIGIQRGNEQIGELNVEHKNGSEVATIRWSEMYLDEAGKGYGSILYAEAGERVRRDGATSLEGDLTNDESVPLIVREKVFGKGSTKVDYKGKKMSVADFRKVDPEGVDWNGFSGPRIETSIPSNPVSQKLAADIKAASKGDPITLSERVTKLLDAWEREVLGDPNKGSSGRLLSFGPNELAAWAYRVSKAIIKTGIKFGAWSKSMAGKMTKQQMKDIWQRALAIARSPISVAKHFLDSRADKLWEYSDKNPNSPAMRKLANLIFTRSGPDADATSNSIPQRIIQVRRQFGNAYSNILNRFATEFAKMDGDQRKAWDREFRRAVVGLDPLPPGEKGKAVLEFRKMMEEMLQYQREAGIEIGDAGEGYFPRIWSLKKIQENLPKFYEAAKEMYRKRDLRLLTKAIDEINAGVDAEAARKKALDQKAGRRVKPDAEYQQDARVAADEKIAALQAEHDAKDEAHYQTMAEAWAWRAENGRIDEVVLNEQGTKEANAPDHADPRMFTNEEAALADEFMDDDIDKTVMRYVASAVKKSELARNFGENGKEFGKLFMKLKEEGLGSDERKHIAKLVRQSLDVTTNKLEGFEAGFFDWANMIVVSGYLGLSYINNLFLEPISYGIRTGSPLLAVEAVAKTWYHFGQELKRSVNDSDLVRKYYGNRVEMAKAMDTALAETLGLTHIELDRIAQDSTWDFNADAEETGSPTARWITQRVLKANLMEQSERAKVSASVAIARGHLLNVARTFNGNSPLQKVFSVAGLNVKAEASARSMLREAGVADADHASFSAFVASLQGMNDADYMAAVTGDSREAKIYRQAVQRTSTGMAIQTDLSMKTEQSDTIYGKMLMQLMNYSYAYSNLVKDRMYDSALKAANPMAQISKLDRVKYAMPLLTGGAMTVAASIASKALIASLFPSDSGDDWLEKEDELKVMDSASYAGMFGKKFEYAAKIVSGRGLPFGPIPEAIGKGLVAGYSSVAKGGDSDTANYNFAKSIKDTGVRPLIVGGASAINPALGAVANYGVRRRDVSDAIVEGLSGTENPKKK